MQEKELSEESLMQDKEIVVHAISYLMDRAHSNARDHGFHDSEKPLKELTDVLVEKLMPHLTIGEWVRVMHKVDDVRRQLEMKNDAAAMMLIVTEVSEAVEAMRNERLVSLEHAGAMGIKQSRQAEELADACIRVFDYCGKYGIDLGRVILRKMDYNETRPVLHGKAF